MQEIALIEHESGRRAVYIERDVIVGEKAAADRHREPRPAFLPGAHATLDRLADSHDVVIVSAQTLPSAPGAVPFAVLAQLPVEHPAGSWLLTADPAVCAGARPAGLRTMLVGPRRPPDRRPTARCDEEARDLAAAVMAILVRDTLA